MWDTLIAAGLPNEFENAIKMLYRDNKHHIRMQGALFEGPTVRSGVGQGCPLSALLFAICADVLLVTLQSVLKGTDEIVRAFADHTAIVIEDYTVSLCGLSMIFWEYEQISGLFLNLKKTVFIPLWSFFGVKLGPGGIHRVEMHLYANLGRGRANGRTANVAYCGTRSTSTLSL